MLCFLASEQSICVDSPSIVSANYSQGYLSRVHMKNGAVHIYCKPITLTFSSAATSIIFLIRSINAFFCVATGYVVGKTIMFWIAPIFTILRYRSSYFSHLILNCFTYKFKLFAALVVALLKGISSA